MNQGISLAASLGLPGLEIFDVAQESDGSWVWHVTAAEGVAGVCCPSCRREAGRRTEPVVQTVKHLVVVPVRVVWHKWRWRCGNDVCERSVFTETGPLTGAGGRVSTAGKAAMGHLVGEWLVPVNRVAAGAGVSWGTAHEGFVRVAADAQIVVTDTRTAPDQGGCDQGGCDQGAPGDGEGGGGAAGLADRAIRSVTGLLPPVEVLGIDDHRRGRPLFHRDPASGAWVADADRWQSVFVDAAGGHGLLGQVEGRAGVDVTGWLSAQDPGWLAAVRYVTIDMSSVYKSAVTRSGLLPDARLVVDLFHVIQLANKTVGDVRRRVTFEHYGRRGRAADPEYQVKNLLVRGQEKLSKTARHKLLVTLADLGEGGRQIGAAWRAKELLRDLVKLSPNRTGRAPTRPQISAALEAFFLFCHTAGAAVPEIQTLAETVSAWRAEICRGVATGHSNSASEGVNRLVKLVYRTAFGFRNVSNQQRRSRYAASRSTRTAWLTPQRHHQAAPQPQTGATPPPTALPLRQTHSSPGDLPRKAEDRQIHTVTTPWAQQVAA
jgi:transposase